MKSVQLIFMSIMVLVLTSCVEIIDDLALNDDGSGTFKYNINLSSSKVKINSILALDSLDGRKVPSLEDIKRRVDKVLDKLETQKGITNINFESDYNDFMFKLTCDFDNLSNLQQAVKNIIQEESGNKEIPDLEYDWLKFENNTLTRSVPQITIQKTKEINHKDIHLLKDGTYTSITRFERSILSFENEDSKVAKNQRAIMLRTDPYSLTQNPNLLDNSIVLEKKQEE